MTLKCRFKITGHITFRLESKLIHRYGFRIFSRRQGEYIVIEKEVPKPPAVKLDTELTEDEQARIIKRCNSVVDFYDNAQGLTAKYVRQRLHNIAQSSPIAEAAFIRDWMERNVDKD